MSEILTDEETDVSSLASGRDDDDSRGDCMTKDLIAMILQFMEASGLHESYRTFWNECDSFGFPMPPEGHSVLLVDNLSFGPRDANLLFKYFDFEEKDELLAQWSKFIRAIETDQQQDFKKITFFVRIFSAIIPFRKNEALENKSKSMGELRDFFQEKSDEFSTDEKMLSLFALPFVADPATHPVFKEIFQDSWKSKLRSQLSLSIKKYCEFNNLPTIAGTDLVQLYLSPPREDFDDEEESKSRCVSTQQDIMSGRTLQSVHDNLKSMESALLDVELRYHKLLKVTAEMVGALESTVQGEAQDMTALRNRVTSVFPELFNAFQISYQNLPENAAAATSQADEHQSDFDDEGILSIASDPYDSETDAELKLFKSRRTLDTRISETELPPKESFENSGNAKEPDNYIPPPPESLYDRREHDEQEQSPKLIPRSENISSVKKDISPVSELLKSNRKSSTSMSDRNSDPHLGIAKPESRGSQSSKVPTPPYSLKSTKGGESFTVMNTNSPAAKRTYAKTMQPTRSPFSAQHTASQTIVGKKRWSGNSSTNIIRDGSIGIKAPVRKPSKTIQPKQA
ncbi:unnamed protein product [Allacma fusca]|uniref:ARMC9 CTLH-like domain-containing protein n=1 Tax=Allacma fusca TaxID=39272 RepID=A0A8J2JS21_9HEXA|nr:unnamed protein product [Allacma fusca]